MDARKQNEFAFHSTSDADFKKLNRSESFYEDKKGIHVVKKKLGEGRYGKVRLFCNEKTGSPTVIKEIQEDNYNAREPKYIALIDGYCHTSLSPKGETRRLKIPYLEGKPLGTIAKRLQPVQALKVYLNLLKRVAHLHKTNHIVHLDLHPYNILVADDDKVNLCDFGLSRKINDMTALLETFDEETSHVAPELQKPKRAHPNQDIYSLGRLIRPDCTFGKIIRNLPMCFLSHVNYLYTLMIKQPPTHRGKLEDIISQIENLFLLEPVLTAIINNDVKSLQKQLKSVPLSPSHLHFISIYAIRNYCYPESINILLSYQPDLLNLKCSDHALIAAMDRGDVSLAENVIAKMDEGPWRDRILKNILSYQKKTQSAVSHIQACDIWGSIPMLHDFFKKTENKSTDVYIEEYVSNIFFNSLTDSYLERFQDISLVLDESILARIFERPLPHDSSLTILTGAAKNGAFRLVNYFIQYQECKVPADLTTYLSYGLIHLLNDSKQDLSQLDYFFSKNFSYDFNIIDPQSELSLKELLIEWLVEGINKPGSALFKTLKETFPAALIHELLSEPAPSENKTLLIYAALTNPFLIEEILPNLNKDNQINVNDYLSYAFCHFLHLKNYEEAYNLKTKYPKIDLTLRHPKVRLTSEQIFFRDICHAARCNQVELLINLKQLFPEEFLRFLQKEDLLGNTPLMIAIINSKEAVASFLIKRDNQAQLDFIQKFITKGLYAEVHAVLREFPSITLHHLWNEKQTIEECLFEKFLHSLLKGNLQELSHMQRQLPLIVNKFLSFKNTDNNTVWDILYKQKQENPELRYSQVYGLKQTLFSVKSNGQSVKWWLTQFSKFKGVSPLKSTPDPKTVSLPYVQIYNWINGLPGFIKPEEKKLHMMRHK